MLIDAEHVAGEIRPEPARRTQAGHHGNEPATLAQDATPTAPRRPVVRVVAHVDIKRDPEPPEPVALRTVGIAVVGAGNVPARAGGKILVGDTVAVRIAQAGRLGPLGDEEILAVPQQAERFVQSRGEELVRHPVGLGREDAIEEPDLALADREREFAVGGPVHAADLKREAVARLPILGARIRHGARGQDIDDFVGRRAGEGGRGQERGDDGFHFQR